jgi:hypothetical protein
MECGMSRSESHRGVSNLEEVFRRALLDDLYGYHVFEKQQREHYRFHPEETGDSVWLVPRGPSEPDLEARLFSNELKAPSAPVVIPFVQDFEHSVSFDSLMLYDRAEDVVDMVADGGKYLACALDKPVLC